MGSSYTNVQVSTRSRAPDDVRRAVLRAIGTMAGQTYVEARSDEQSDRTVLVGPAEPWIAVFDEVTESQDEGVLEQLAIALTSATKTPAVTVLVHDGDLLRLALVRD